MFTEFQKPVLSGRFAGFARLSFQQEQRVNENEDRATMLYRDKNYTELCLTIQFVPRGKHSQSRLLRDRQCTFNMTMKRVLETTVAVGKHVLSLCL